MSWIDKVQTQLVIIMGDGEPFSPFWLNATKSKEYNVTEFDFHNLPGTLVSRTTPRGVKYELELYFQGEDHLDISEGFSKSADDPRPWTISHPLYGSITVQPTSLSFDNTKYNVSKITGTVIETITEDSPKTFIDPTDKIATDKVNTDEVFAQSFATEVIPETTEINKMSANNTSLYKEGVKGIKSAIDAEEYFNKFNTANTAILNATSKPLEAIRTLQAVINYPAEFRDGVRNRVNVLLNQFNILRASISTLLKRTEKKIYENNAGTILSAIAYAASTGEYGNRNDVISVIDTLTSTYDLYIGDLDSLESDNGGKVGSYIADPDSLIALNSLINYTISNLFNIALNSKQERSILCEDDTNVILLAHRFYGLKADDSTIEEIINNNAIGLNELLQIQKGRKIVYYV